MPFGTTLVVCGASALISGFAQRAGGTGWIGFVWLAGIAIMTARDRIRGGLVVLAVGSAYLVWLLPVRQNWAELLAFLLAGAVSVYGITMLSNRAPGGVEPRFTALLSSEIVGIFTRDIDGNILVANNTFARMLQFRPEDLSGLDLSALTPPEDRDLYSQKFRELNETGSCEPWRMEFLARDGTRTPVLAGAARVRDKSCGAVVVTINLTDLNRVENNLQHLAGRLLNLYDDERRHIARELHDTTAQNLAALSMNLSMLTEAISNRGTIQAIVEECTNLTEECLREVRSLSYMLHPPLLDELGLTSALRSFVELYHRRTGVVVELKAESFPRLAPELELAAFRIAQEALFNVHRHSGSPKTEVALIRSDTQLEVLVRDWGSGIGNEALEHNSLGIAGMRERARLLGGQLEIRRAEPGTVVRAVLPVEQV